MGGASRGQPQWGGAGPSMAAYEGECHVTFCLIVTFLKIAESTQLYCPRKFQSDRGRGGRVVSGRPANQHRNASRATTS